MINSVFSILGIDPAAMQIPDAAVLVVVAIIFLYSMDWIFHFISMIVATLTRRK